MSKPDPDIKLGLENIEKLLNLLNCPQDRLSGVVHIAGTNGKGSTLAFLESIIKNTQSEVKMGKYISPHLFKINERITINGQEISDQRYQKLAGKVDSILQEHDFTCTFFERITAIACLYFAEEEVDYCLLETGLGGRLDATNLVSPTICAITNVALDHQEYLGETIEDIAYEKAGILKADIPYLTTASGPALSVIRAYAAEIGAKELELLGDLAGVELGLAGGYQRENALLAANIAGHLFPDLEWGEIESPLRGQINWPGRMQRVQYKGREIIFDACHNPAGMEAFLKEISQEERPRVYLIGLLNSKDKKAMLEIFSKHLKKEDLVIFTNVGEPEVSADPNILESLLGHEKILSIPDQARARAMFLDSLGRYDSAAVCGSIYLLEVFEDCINPKHSSQ